MFTRRSICLLGGAAVLAATIAYAWGSTGHKFINLKAVLHLPAAMASFRADSAFYQSHASDADIRRNTSDTSFYSEWPRHFIDIDDYPDFRNLPHSLDSVIRLYGWERVKQNGINPWATQWVMDTLTAQLARGDRAAARYTMSDLGHYVGDAHQPLHCTENYDGWFTGNGGIHSRYESSMINLYQAFLTVSPESVHYIASPLDFAFGYILASNDLVDSILLADDYAKSVSGWSGSGTVPSTYYAALWERTRALTLREFQSATVDLASLWYTAWVNAGTGTSVEDVRRQVREFALLQNYPNPFNPATKISFVTQHPTRVSVEVFDLIGRSSGRLLEEQLEPGEHAVVWDASASAAGVYICRVRSGTDVQEIRMLLVK
jgi:hypothetical protein